VTRFWISDGKNNETNKSLSGAEWFTPSDRGSG
jgi:hypothetical protein